jgi:CubicO group peptidase (beta-lactamase class C family)
MTHRLTASLLSLLITSSVLAASLECEFEQAAAGPKTMGPWIDKQNWLSVENQRLSLQSGEIFMPHWRLPPAKPTKTTSMKVQSLDDFRLLDPQDGQQRNLGFLLDSRLYTDGLLVLRNGRVIVERYRNGLAPDKPRLLLNANRPLLNLLGAMSVNQGKLSAEKSVIRYIPRLAASNGLRKISVQRLLTSEVHHAWAQDELDSWQQASSWTSDQAGNSLRKWLSQPERWDKPLLDREAATFDAAPDDDLLAWALAESNGMPLSRLFCEQLLKRINRENAALWLSDAEGVELASGLGLSLRDFAKLGQLLVDARNGRSRARIPGWFIETLLAPASPRATPIKGLSKGSEQRYGFIHLGGTPNRAALIGAHGTSLYIDFDKRLVIAIYATRPGEVSPGTLALLEHVWKAIGSAIDSPKRGGAQP